MIELLAAVLVLGLGGLALFSTFGRNYRVSVMNRNQIASAFVAASFFEEVEAHRYGADFPTSWPSPLVCDQAPTLPTGAWETAGYPTTQSLPLWVEGNQVSQVFHRQVVLKNGSFAGKGLKENWDEVTLTVSWRESGNPNNPSGIKQFTARRMVWRENAVP